MIKVYQYMPGWSVSCISPYVSKLYNYLTMTGLPFEMVQQEFARLQEDAPRGKLPYIVDDDGTVVPDSTEIILYLKGKYGDPLDGDATPEERASMVAWSRMIDEHTYWCGVIQPRWRMDEGWEVYVPIIAQSKEVPGELRAALDAFRAHIRDEFDKQGMGLKSDEDVFETFKVDVDAIETFLGDKPFFMGEKPRSIDASLFSILTHTMEAPFAWPGRDYIRGKASFAPYLERMRAKYDLTLPFVSYA